MAAMTGDEVIISAEEGAARVRSEGVIPFLQFIDSGRQSFFKAHTFVSLYDYILNLCIQSDPYDCSPAMYAVFVTSVEDYVKGTVAPALDAARADYDVALLRTWVQRWTNHTLVLLGLAKLFMYLDRFYTRVTPGIAPLRERGYQAYYEYIFVPYAPYVRTAILAAIEKERAGDTVDRMLLRSAVEVFVAIGKMYKNPVAEKVYATELEKYILDATTAYYQRTSRTWLDHDSTSVYLHKVEQVWRDESQRVAAYLDASSLAAVLGVCQLQLLNVHLTEIVRKNTGLVHLLQTNAHEDLTLLYKLFQGNSERIQVIAVIFEEFITGVG
jgi:cullin 1